VVGKILKVALKWNWTEIGFLIRTSYWTAGVSTVVWSRTFASRFADKPDSLLATLVCLTYPEFTLDHAVLSFFGCFCYLGTVEQVSSMVSTFIYRPSWRPIKPLKICARRDRLCVSPLLAVWPQDRPMVILSGRIWCSSAHVCCCWLRLNGIASGQRWLV